nr:Trk system potassium transport protein TrkA [candidate division Zixibacteria bacterium]NIS48579.1 Trk system potassium transport protein TrkA [candidate division Zixibacteria bacterium]NIU16657.1 Trk system potassium transport protein TrkA [candidate division Zixibacteria bacterium]NIV08818.1 Trk system potassium transport protein TrkA [candidate division Zixibacteria bacterium]NIW49286.1 Trk system potassium transport protein TrkA [Gammaproteobacteria bacterium]
LPGSLLILAIRREGELMIPRGNLALEMDDTLTLLGRIDDLESAQQFFERG